MNKISNGYAVISNTDLTEGKVCNVYLYICDNLTTANRLANEYVVHGAPAMVAMVQEVDLFMHNTMLYGPVSFESATTQDRIIEADRMKAYGHQKEIDTICAILLKQGISQTVVDSLNEHINGML